MPALDFWFDFASTYSYVGALRVEAACAAAAVSLRHRPFLLGPLFSEQLGIRDSPFNVHERRGRYMWRDLERLCGKHDLGWRRPSAFPRHSVLAARVACAGEGRPWLPAFVRAVFAANFADDREIADREVLRSLLKPLGADAAAALDRAETAEVKARLRASTEEASRLGFFGAPTFVAFPAGEPAAGPGEIFFGQDRLEDAVAWAAAAARARP